MSEVLTQRVKRKLNITWDDEDTNARVDDIMDSVGPYLCHKLGLSPEFDFSAPGTERDLFLSCCLYEWNHIPRDEWEENYKHTIADVRARLEVEHYLKGQEATTDGEA
jgi:hypothetical protein